MAQETNATICIKNKQVFEENEEVIEIITEGNFYNQNGKYYILYEENEQAGIRGSSSAIKIDKNIVSIKRKGDYNSSFSCEENKKSSFVYHMPYGDMAMDIYTKSINISLGDNGGDIELKYTLDVNGENYFNDILITVRKNK